MVNGQKVNKHKLQSGDEVRLGDIRIVVTIGEPQPVVEATQQIDMAQLMVGGTDVTTATTAFAAAASALGAAGPRPPGLPALFPGQGAPQGQRRAR